MSEQETETNVQPISFALVPIDVAQAMLNYFNEIPLTRRDIVNGHPVAQFCAILEGCQTVSAIPEERAEPTLKDSLIVKMAES